MQKLPLSLSLSLSLLSFSPVEAVVPGDVLEPDELRVLPVVVQLLPHGVSVGLLAGHGELYDLGEAFGLVVAENLRKQLIPL